MADLYCPKCGEPWDMDSIHEIADENKCSYDQAAKMFRSQGCTALGTRHNEDNEENPPLRAMASAVFMDLMGDDLDGVAATLEDFDYAGLLD